MTLLSRGRRIQVVRRREAARPVQPVRREVISAVPAKDDGRAPLLFVPGLAGGAWMFTEWLDYAAARGFPAYAMSLRGHGDSDTAPGAGLRAYTHDVVQVASSLPRQAVLIGHGAAAPVVARALARYPARAAVLTAPVVGGWRHGWATVGRALVRNPVGTLPALVGARLRLRRGQLFSRQLDRATADDYARRMGRAPTLAHWQMVAHRLPESPVGDPPVLVVGSPQDAVVSRAALDRVARRYSGAPLLFPGMGHALMRDARWQEPIGAILDWLEKA